MAIFRQCSNLDNIFVDVYNARLMSIVLHQALRGVHIVICVVLILVTGVNGSHLVVCMRNTEIKQSKKGLRKLAEHLNGSITLLHYQKYKQNLRFV